MMVGIDTAMVRAQQAFRESGMTLEEVGEKMGYAPGIARRAAWQFLSKTADPRISMLRKFARALDIPLEELVAEKKKGRSG